MDELHSQLRKCRDSVKIVLLDAYIPMKAAIPDYTKIDTDTFPEIESILIFTKTVRRHNDPSPLFHILTPNPSSKG